MTTELWLKERSIKFRKSGKEYEIGCIIPECPNAGEPQLYISEDGMWKCHRCNNAGKNLRSLEFKAGLVKLQDPVTEERLFISPEDVNKMHKDFLGSVEAKHYYYNQRGHSKSSALQFKIGLTVKETHPALVFPFFDASGACVGLKYDFYTRPKGIPKYKLEKGSKIQLFNLQRIDKSQAVYITEGEHDAITCWEYGYENVGSMPNGANGVTEWVEDIKDASQFYLCTDNDSAGNEGARRLGEAIGLSKCYRVYPRLKDFNDYLQVGLSKDEFKKTIESAVALFEAPVCSIEEYREKAKESVLHPDTYKGWSTGWEAVDKIIGGIRPKEYTIVSGLTGNGKSTYSFALVANLLQQEVPCLIISPEMQEQDMITTLASSMLQKKVATGEEIDEFVDKYKDRLYVANVFGQWTGDKQSTILKYVFELIDHAHRHKGVKFVVIDHLHLFLDSSAPSEKEAIDAFSRRCVQSAISDNIHIWLVVQPRKLAHDQRKATSRDLKGSSNLEQDASNIICVHRNLDDGPDSTLVELSIEKNRKYGILGEVVLEYDLNSRANYYEGKQE